MILNDKQIRSLCQGDKPMISPFVEKLKEEGVISYGLSTCGYDVRVGNEFRIFEGYEYAYDGGSPDVNPKEFDERCYAIRHIKEGRVATIPANSFCLAATIEYFRMPRNVVGKVFNKSTYARSGIACPACILEPGWEGHLTLEIANHSSHAAWVYPNEGIAQIIFEYIEDPEVSYADRDGKYQGQVGVTGPRVK